MARKLAPLQQDTTDFVGATPPAIAATEVIVRRDIDAREATVRAIALRIGYQLPADAIDPDLIQRDIAANMRRSVEACLEVGRGLRVLKEACEHGQFMARLDVLGLEPSVAQRFMQAATKFSNAATSQHLTKAIGSQSKLFEMLVLDDEQIEELELTGQTGELTLDDVATMSVKELRAALRKARHDAESTDRILAEKNRKLDDLARQGSHNVDYPQEFARLNDEIGTLGSVLDEALGKQLLFVEAAEALMDQLTPEQLPAGRSCVHRIGEAIGRFCHLAASLRHEYETRLAGYVAEDKSHLLVDDEA